jgi:hypothetical protein
MCGGGKDRASRAAQTAEDERQRQVRDSTAAIDRTFAGRQGQLDEFANALRENFRTDAEKQKTVADRQLKFSLARGGLTGGSAAADAGTQLADEFQEGLLSGERKVQGSLSDLALADEGSRRNLVALAQGGASIGTSTNQAGNALRSNLASARSSGLATDLGDVFSNTRGLFVKQQEAAARRRGLQESNVFAEPFSRGS